MTLTEPSRPAARLARRAWRRVRAPHPATGPLLTAAGVLAASVMVHLVDPNEPGNYPTCPWLLMTGTYCPGCGTMRAVAALTHGDLAGAWQMNPLLIVLLPPLLGAWVHALYRAWRPPTRLRRMANPVWLWVMMGGIGVFWVVRNTPALSVLAPGGVPAPALG